MQLVKMMGQNGNKDELNLGPDDNDCNKFRGLAHHDVPPSAEKGQQQGAKDEIQSACNTAAVAAATAEDPPSPAKNPSNQVST